MRLESNRQSLTLQPSMISIHCFRASENRPVILLLHMGKNTSTIIQLPVLHRMNFHERAKIPSSIHWKSMNLLICICAIHLFLLAALPKNETPISSHPHPLRSLRLCAAIAASAKKGAFHRSAACPACCSARVLNLTEIAWDGDRWRWFFPSCCRDLKKWNVGAFDQPQVQGLIS